MLRLFDQDGIMVRQFSSVMLPAVPRTNSRFRDGDPVAGL